MTADKIQRLEKNDKFKRKFYSRGIWKSYSIVPPSMVLFIGLFGLLFLFNSDRLISLYAIPFLILLLLGTIWLKATRKYLVDRKIEEGSQFEICLSIPLMKRDSKTIMMFSKGKNRHNKYYLEKEKNEILDRFEQNPGFVDFGILEESLITLPEKDIFLIYPKRADRLSNKRRSLTVNKYVIFDGVRVVGSISKNELEGFGLK